MVAELIVVSARDVAEPRRAVTNGAAGGFLGAAGHVLPRFVMSHLRGEISIIHPFAFVGSRIVRHNDDESRRVNVTDVGS
jgi:hypothetical protein